MHNKGFLRMLGVNILVILFFSSYFFWNKNYSQMAPGSAKSLEQQIIAWASTTTDIVVQVVAEDTAAYYQEESFDKDTLIEKQSILKKWTGIIISKKGYIITNNHVVDNLNLKYTVITDDGKSFPVKKIRKDDMIDIAIIFIEIETPLLSEAKFIDLDEPVNVWQFVFAIGNPLSEYPNTVSFWIISGKWRKLTIDSSTNSYYAGFYQTDAALNPWNSWWPLISLSGDVLGIVTAISRGGNNIGFAIPLNYKFITTTLEILQQNNLLLRPYLGISYTDTSTWAKIDTIFAGSPVQWQLLVGDIIISLDKRKISLINPLLYYLYTYKPGETVVFTIIRNNQTLSFPVVLGQKTL